MIWTETQCQESCVTTARKWICIMLIARQDLKYCILDFDNHVAKYSRLLTGLWKAVMKYCGKILFRDLGFKLPRTFEVGLYLTHADGSFLPDLLR